jgi:hypothetical protein
MQLDFDSIFDEYIDANQKTWEHDRRDSVGASEAFDCLRKIWFRKRSKDVLNAEGLPLYQTDPDHDPSWGAAERGNLIEEHFVVPAVRDHLPGIAKLLMAGKAQKTVHWGANSATPDGLIVGLEADALAKYGIADIGSDCIVIEMKSIDPRVNLHGEEKAIHHGQAQVQMGIIRETTNWKPNYAVVLYVDASFLDQVRPFIVPFDHKAWEVAQTRANKIWQVQNPAEIMAEGKLTKGCEHCEYQNACALVTVGSIPPDRLKEMQDEDVEAIEPLVMEHQRLSEVAKEAAQAFELIKVDLKEALKVRDSRKVARKNGKKAVWSASWYSQPGRKTIDVKRLIEENDIDPEAYEKTGDPFDVLRVTFAD